MHEYIYTSCICLSKTMHLTIWTGFHQYSHPYSPHSWKSEIYRTHGLERQQLFLYNTSGITHCSLVVSTQHLGNITAGDSRCIVLTRIANAQHKKYSSLNQMFFQKYTHVLSFKLSFFLVRCDKCKLCLVMHSFKNVTQHTPPHAHTLTQARKHTHTPMHTHTYAHTHTHTHTRDSHQITSLNILFMRSHKPQQHKLPCTTV